MILLVITGVTAFLLSLAWLVLRQVKDADETLAGMVTWLRYGSLFSWFVFLVIGLLLWQQNP